MTFRDVTWVSYEKPVDGIQLRDTEGNTFPGSLQLQLRDFGPQADLDRLYPGAELDKTITIPFKDIVDYIREAETEQEMVKDIPIPPKNMRKRPRSEVSVEGLDSQDERELKRREKRADYEA